MAKLIINNILGLAPGPITRTNLKVGSSYHIANSFAMDPITLPGVLKPGRAVSTDLDSGNKIAATLKRAIGYYDTQSKFFMIENGVKVHAVLAADGTVDDAGSFANYPLSITATGTHGAHTTFVADDIVNYSVGSTDYNFVSYNDNTDGDVARGTIDGATFTKDFMSNTAAGGAALGKFPHPLLTPENGFMYIADGPSIHKFDGGTGANGTFSGTVIDLPRTWIIKDMLDYGGFNWILASQDFALRTNGISAPRKAGVFLWNYINRRSAEFTGFSSSGPYYFYDVADIGPLFVHDGIPHCFVLTPNNTTQLKRFSGTEFSTVWEESGNLLPYKGAISKFYGHIMWQPQDASGICTFGRTSRDFPEVFNKIGSTDGSTGGLLVQGSTGNIWAAYNSELRLLGGMYTSPSFTTLIAEFPKLSYIKSATVFFKPFTEGTNSTLTVNMYRDFSGTPVSGSYTLTHAADGARGFKYFKLGGKNFQNFNCLRMNFSYSLAGAATSSFEIYRVEVEYETMGKIK